jgi:hypothetical protein
MSLNLVYDATHDKVINLPKNATYAGYTTGSAGVRWTKEDWERFPDAIRIDQDANASDGTADFLDIEGGAATAAESAGWVRRARASFHGKVRHGQREPGIYASESRITDVVNHLIAGGITSGVNLWVADWNFSQSQAASDVTHASGPFPIVGMQFRNAGPYDVSLFSVAYLVKRSLSLR